jgi:3-oxoacyl-[acyl-carrier-protein] synthase-3
LPPGTVTNEDLAKEFPEWPAAKILDKVGINSRHVADEATFASDLAVACVQRLFAERAIAPAEIDFLVLCTQSPDYFLPTTACLMQDRLGLPTTCGAFDFNLGCSGYVYGLGIVKGLIETGQARRVLLVTAETYSKFIHRRDKSLRCLFGDAAACTLLTGVDTSEAPIGEFVYGTDGRGGTNLIARKGSLREQSITADRTEIVDEYGNVRCAENLFMNGPEIFNFTLKAVPELVRRTLERNHLTPADVSLFVFHQANQYMLGALQKKLRIPDERFLVHLLDCGNTVSSTIPIALAEAIKQGRAKKGDVILLAGFGVGYSWAGTIVRL